MGLSRVTHYANSTQSSASMSDWEASQPMRILSSAVFMMMYGRTSVSAIVIGQVRVAAGGGHVALIGELLGVLIPELSRADLLAFAQAESTCPCRSSLREQRAFRLS